MGIEEQPSNAENELQKKILEIGNVMDKIQLMPIDFTIQPSGVETNEEAVCNMIAYVLQEHENLTNEYGYDMPGRMRVENALKAKLLEKTRDIGENVTTSKKLVLWLDRDPNFCCDIDPMIRREVQIFLETAYMSKELTITTAEERQKMWKDAEREFKKLSPEERNKLIRECEQEERWRDEISDLKWSEELKKNMDNDDCMA